MDEQESKLELTFDYMAALKIYIEEEYNMLSNDNDSDIIIELIRYLRDMEVKDDDIKIAMHLLYDTIDPTKKDIIDNIFNVSRTNTLSTIFSNIANNTVINNTDLYTGDIINPSGIINLFTANLNNLHNNNFHVVFSDITNNNLSIFTNTYDSFTYDFVMPALIRDEDDIKDVATENILDENTKIILFKELDTSIKTNFNTCYICLADFSDEDIIRTLKCVHIFHKECIDPWLLNESHKCPVCRDDTMPHEQI